VTSETQLCKDCVHCAARVEHGLYTQAQLFWDSAVCRKTGTFSYVTGGIINADLCQSRRVRMGTLTCPDFEVTSK
jgi:hypothetical protein